MKERPILFRPHLVRSIISGEKNQTRRLVRNPPSWWDGYDRVLSSPEGLFIGPIVDGICTAPAKPSPYGVPGDRLWVREPWASLTIDGQTLVAYKATCPRDEFDYANQFGCVTRVLVERWRPSIHMPRVACRLVLEVTHVRAERLQEITEEDAEAEGVVPLVNGTPVKYLHAFRHSWDEINAKRATWASNPWVWTIGFKPVAEPTP